MGIMYSPLQQSQQTTTKQKTKKKKKHFNNTIIMVIIMFMNILRNPAIYALYICDVMAATPWIFPIPLFMCIFVAFPPCNFHPSLSLSLCVFTCHFCLCFTLSIFVLVFGHNGPRAWPFPSLPISAWINSVFKSANRRWSFVLQSSASEPLRLNAPPERAAAAHSSQI